MSVFSVRQLYATNLYKGTCFSSAELFTTNNSVLRINFHNTHALLDLILAMITFLHYRSIHTFLRISKDCDDHECEAIAL